MKTIDIQFSAEEKKWRKEMSQRDTGKEILETMTYSEAKELLTPILEDRINNKKLLEKDYKSLARITKKYYAPDTLEYNFVIRAVWILKYLNEDLSIKEQLKELKKYWIFNETRKPKSKFTSQSKTSWLDFTFLIQEAEQVPIENLCQNPCQRAGTNKLKCICPFHTEKTPSFVIYTDTNTYHCFGCKEHGNSIIFYQKLFGVDFIEAVKRLTGKY